MASAPSDGAGTCRGGRDLSHLLDVLEMLPLDGVLENIWDNLAPTSQRAFKLTCRQSTKLAGHLIDVVYARIFSPEHWQDPEAAQQRVAFLSQLPHLSAVELWGWPDGAAFNAAVQQFGDAAGGRITHVALRNGALRTAGMAALRAAFPQLQTLEIEVHMRDLDALDAANASNAPEWDELAVTTFPAEPVLPLGDLPGVTHSTEGAEAVEGDGLEGGGEGSDASSEEWADDTMWVDADVFHPLHDSLLTKLVIHEGGGAYFTEAVLRSLGGLCRLQHLNATLAGITARHLAPLSALSNLRHCELWDQAGNSAETAVGPLSVADLCPLFSSTRLTALQLKSVDVLTHGAATGEPPYGVAQALWQLAALTDMCSLELGCLCVIDDAAFSALRRLTKLTALYIERMCLTSPPLPGHLPLLQQLWLNATLPGDVLQTLQPLLPLPSLTAWDLGPLELAVHCDSSAAGGADAQAAALVAVVKHLTAAPRLQLQGAVKLTGTRGKGHLSLAQLAAGLRPLAGRLSSLSVVGVSPDCQSWDVTHLALPGLQQLTLTRCHISSPARAVLALPGLTRLRLQDCTGPERDEQRGWHALAAQCARPLQLAVEPALPAELVAVCRERQQQLYGTQHIRWMCVRGA